METQNPLDNVQENRVNAMADIISRVKAYEEAKDDMGLFGKNDMYRNRISFKADPFKL